MGSLEYSLRCAPLSLATAPWPPRRASSDSAGTTWDCCCQPSEFPYSRLCCARFPDRCPRGVDRVLLRLEILGRLPQSSSRDRLKLGAPDLSARTVFDLRKVAPFRGCLVSPNAAKVYPRCSSHPEQNQLFWIE